MKGVCVTGMVWVVHKGCGWVMENVSDAMRVWVVQKEYKWDMEGVAEQGGCGWYRWVLCGTWNVWVMQGGYGLYRKWCGRDLECG
jgi:hypothetical protein